MTWSKKQWIVVKGKHKTLMNIKGRQQPFRHNGSSLIHRRSFLIYIEQIHFVSHGGVKATPGAVKHPSRSLGPKMLHIVIRSSSPFKTAASYS